MLRVSTAIPCHGERGGYELWTHHVVLGAEVLRFSKLPLAREWRVEERFADCDMRDPEAVFNQVSPLLILPVMQRLRLSPNTLATTSLVRICNRATHEDERQTKKDAQRLEVVTRHLWLAPAMGRSALKLSTVTLSEQGIGTVEVPLAPDRTAKRPIVSVPLTWEELTGTDSDLAFALAGSTTFENAVLGVFHLSGGKPIEGLRLPIASEQTEAA